MTTEDFKCGLRLIELHSRFLNSWSKNFCDISLHMPIKMLFQAISPFSRSPERHCGVIFTITTALTEDINRYLQ